MIPRQRAGTLTILTIAAALLLGCAGIGKPFKAPEVSFAGLKVDKIDLFEAVLTLDLRVFNTNDVSLEVRGVECELELNERSFAKGVSGREVTVAALSSDVVSLTVYTSGLEVASSLLRFMQQELSGSDSPELKYRLTGKLHLGGQALLPPVIPFDRSGILRLDELVKAGKVPG